MNFCARINESSLVLEINLIRVEIASNIMLGKKLFELCYRPMHLFASINISYQCSPLTNINPPREKLPLAINEEYRDNHENPNDDTWWRFSPAAALLPIFYIASEKGKKISCFFRSSADKLEVSSFALQI